MPATSPHSSFELAAWSKFLHNQRWFAGKARDICHIGPRAIAQLSHAVGNLAMIDVAYDHGPAEQYLVALPSDGRLFDGLQEAAICRELYDTIANAREIPAVASAPNQAVGNVVGVRTSKFAQLAGADAARQLVRPSSHDQSNSAVQFGDQLFLKLFRKLEAGENPDYEIARFLTERTAFTRFPQVAGALEFYGVTGEVTTLAVLQAWVPNQGTAWQAMLAEVRRFIADGMFDERPIALLGRRTAEMHLALASDANDPVFMPEPMTSDDVEVLIARLQHGAEATFTSIAKFADGDDATSQAVSQLLRIGPSAVQLAARLKTIPLAAKTRVHGDYHLGQVLCQDGDFIILDFEGEPARPLAERRAKDSPLRDVAGMLRSFGYAAHVGLVEAIQSQAPTDEQRANAAAWRRQAEKLFWQSYRTTAAGAPFLPADQMAARSLLEFYVVEKALYEVRYEANNRPDWIGVPLVGLLEIFSRQ